MERLERQALLLQVLERLSEQGSWCGETHLQKCVFFLQRGLHVPFDFDFVLYKHGPFSFDLRTTLGEMTGNLLLEVKQQPYPYGPSLGPGPSSQVLLSQFAAPLSRFATAIDFVAQRFAKANVVTLERLSTALFILQESPEASDDEAAKRITTIKPHISDESAREAVEEVRAILKEIQVRVSVLN